MTLTNSFAFSEEHKENKTSEPVIFLLSAWEGGGGRGECVSGGTDGEESVSRSNKDNAWLGSKQQFSYYSVEQVCINQSN